MPTIDSAVQRNRVLLLSLAGVLAPLIVAMVVEKRATIQAVVLTLLVAAAASRPARTQAPFQSVRRQNGRPAAIRVLIIGAGKVGQALAESLDADTRYDVVGFIDDHPEIGRDAKWPTLACRARTEEIIELFGIQEVYVAYAPTWQQTLAEKLTTSMPDLAVKVVPTPLEARMCTSRVHHRGDIALVSLATPHNNRWLPFKRLLDMAAASLGLVALLPLLVIAAALIKLTSRGSVLFAQERTGRFGRPFIMYKLRTMVEDAEVATGPIRSPGKSDGRLTHIGRWLRLCRMDEIPQLWNVLRGEMSIVGPRPERPCFTDEYARLAPSYARRHEVWPGITGLAQVCSGYHTDARDKLRFDLIYISHLSLWTDLSILARTLWVVAFPRSSQFERHLAVGRDAAVR
jgi:exopolysaccharide biosynthesis polyprenyl glycosylphosphotransferase